MLASIFRWRSSAIFSGAGEIQYVIVQPGFNVSDVPELADGFEANFALVAERRSEGGDGSGMMNRIYRRRTVAGS